MMINVSYPLLATTSIDGGIGEMQSFFTTLRLPTCSRGTHFNHSSPTRESHESIEMEHWSQLRVLAGGRVPSRVHVHMHARVIIPGDRILYITQPLTGSLVHHQRSPTSYVHCEPNRYCYGQEHVRRWRLAVMFRRPAQCTRSMKAPWAS
jgi:hypothetical protein